MVAKGASVEVNMKEERVLRTSREGQPRKRACATHSSVRTLEKSCLVENLKSMQPRLILQVLFANGC